MEDETSLPDLTEQDSRPRDGESIFHYCSAHAFWAICQEQAVWLSSIYTTNDGKELTWGRNLVGRVFSSHLDDFPSGFRQFIKATIPEPDKHLLPLIASFSQEGDLLSQWRAYAEDAAGFVIELDALQASSSMPVNMKRVLYDQVRQETLILNSLRSFHAWWRMGREFAAAHADSLSNTVAVVSAIMEVLPYFAVDLISFKHPSFFEEQEVRMVHLVVKDGDWWSDPGGHIIEKDEVAGVEVRKRKRNGLEIPYIALPLPSIKGVILGPKNPASIDEVKERLALLGFTDTSVRRSSSPYR